MNRLTVLPKQVNRSFSRLLRNVAQGETVQITSRGRAVATLAPVDLREPGRRRLHAQLIERLAAQPIVGAAGQPRDGSRNDLFNRQS